MTGSAESPSLWYRRNCPIGKQQFESPQGIAGVTNLTAVEKILHKILRWVGERTFFQTLAATMSISN
jgi:hypothetical protein